MAFKMPLFETPRFQSGVLLTVAVGLVYFTIFQASIVHNSVRLKLST